MTTDEGQHQRFIRAERQRMIAEGKSMLYMHASRWLRENADKTAAEARACIQLAETMGEYIVFVEAIGSPLVLVCDEPHRANQPGSGRYHIDI